MGHPPVACELSGPFSKLPTVGVVRERAGYARERGCVLVTNNLDFPRILAHTLERKPSIILLRGEPLVPELRGEGVIRAIAECSAELEAGAVLTLDWSDRPRARLLPLK